MAETSRSSEEGQTQANEAKSGAPVYEIGFHLVPSLTEDEATAAYERITKALEKAGVSVLDQETPKKIGLAYRIERSVAGKREKYTEGYFGFIKFEFPEGLSAEEAGSSIGETISGLETMLRGDRQVLRFLLIKTTREAPVAPRTVFSSRSLEGRTIEKPIAVLEERGEVDEGELDKSIEALVGDAPAGEEPLETPEA